MKNRGACVLSLGMLVAAAGTAIAGPLGSDPNAAFRQSVLLNAVSGGGTVTVDSAAYAPGTVIGSGVPTSATRWTYAYQIFDNGVTFDRVRLDTIIGGYAETFGLAAGLGAAGGVDPSALALSMPFGLPSADYFTTPISGTALTTTVYFTSPFSPVSGFIFLRNGADTSGATVLLGTGAVYTPVPGPASAVGLGGLAIAGMAMGRRRRSQS